MTRTRGFTLIELMITIGLFGLIASGAMSLVISANRAQQYSSRVDVAQSSARAGLEFLTRDIVAASTGGSAGAFYDTAKLPATWPAITLTDGGATGTDTLELYLADTRLYGTVLSTVSSGVSTIAVDTSGAFSSATLPCYAFITDVLFTQNPSVFKITSVAPTTVSSVPAQQLTLSAPLVINPAVTNYGMGAMVFRLRHVTYSISTSKFSTPTGGVANESLLMIDMNDGNGAQPLAEGVEDFQAALGIDGLNGGTVDDTITEVGLAANDDEVYGNVAGETVPTSLTGLQWVRVSLVVKATQAETGYLGKPLTVEDHVPTSTTPDGFPRRIVRSEIAVRNFNL